MILQNISQLCVLLNFYDEYYFDSRLDYFDRSMAVNEFNLHRERKSKLNSTLVKVYEITQLAVFGSTTWSSYTFGRPTRAKDAQRLCFFVHGSHATHGME